MTDDGPPYFKTVQCTDCGDDVEIIDTERSVTCGDCSEMPHPTELESVRVIEIPELESFIEELRYDRAQRAGSAGYHKVAEEIEDVADDLETLIEDYPNHD